VPELRDLIGHSPSQVTDNYLEGSKTEQKENQRDFEEVVEKSKDDTIEDRSKEEG